MHVLTWIMSAILVTTENLVRKGFASFLQTILNNGQPQLQNGKKRCAMSMGTTKLVADTERFLATFVQVAYNWRLIDTSVVWEVSCSGSLTSLLS